MNTRTVQRLLDNEWIIAVTEEIAANPLDVAFSVEPDVCGQYDAEHGFPCDPTGRGYRKLGDVEAYTIAWKDTVALWAEMIETKNDEVAADGFDYDGALQELIDGIAEDEWNRRGGS